MKLRTINQPLKLAILGLCLVGAVQGQNSQIVPQVEGQPLDLLVLGDSIMWGQGLRKENKSWHRIKLWLAQQTGRPVIERIESHSGAVIEAEQLEENSTSADGEVNLGRPTIFDQLQRAVKHFPNPSVVDLVLVSGCANDVGAREVLNASNTVEKIRVLTEAKCGQPMERLLRRLSASFPTAYIIVTGYYPFVSEKTRNDMFTRGLTKRFYKAVPGTRRSSDEATFKQIVANSDQWHRSSNRSLAEAVSTINSELGSVGQTRIKFAEVHLLPEHSFRARRTQLWDFESSPVRKLLVILSFGRILLRSNDEVRKQRAASCKEFWKSSPTVSRAQKNERKNEELLCRYAALGHPNREGALTYTRAIEEHLRSVFPVMVKSRR